MFCPKCGANVSKQDKFCSNCGTPILDDRTAMTNSESMTELDRVHYSRSSPERGITVFIVLGWIFFALSFILVPILFGAGAFVMGFLAYRRGRQTHGVILMAFSVAGAIFGMLMGAATGGM